MNLNQTKPKMKKYTNGDTPMPNMLAVGTKVTGDIESQGDIRIDGHIKGKVNALGKVVVGEKGFVEGEIECKRIDISGKVEAKINAGELAVLKASSNVKGDIVTPKISIEPGAVFIGNCLMNTGEKKTEFLNGKQKK